MSNDAREPMIGNNVRLTSRQTSTIDAEAKRKGISFGDQLRRVIDEWIDRPKQTLGQQLYGNRANG